jgi:hypothetical protein
LERKSTKVKNKHEGSLDSGFRLNDGQKLIRLYAKFTKAKKENREDKESGFRPVLAGVTLVGGNDERTFVFLVTFVDIFTRTNS